MPPKNSGITDFAKNQAAGVLDPMVLKISSAAFGTAKNIFSIFKTSKIQEAKAVKKEVKAKEESAKSVDEETKVRKKRTKTTKKKVDKEEKEIKQKEKETKKEETEKKKEETNRKKMFKQSVRSNERGLKDFAKEHIEGVFDPFVLGLTKATLGTMKNVSSKVTGLLKGKIAKMALGGAGLATAAAAGGGGEGGGGGAVDLATSAATGGIASKILSKGFFKGAGKVIGRGAPILGGLVTGGMEYAKSGNLTKSLTIGGSTAGGGLLGMKLGASIGTVLAGPVGTMIGGAIGGIAGGIIGEEFGQKAGEWFENAKSWLDDFGKTAGEWLNGLSDKIGSWIDSAKDWVKEKKDQIINNKIIIGGEASSAEGAGPDMANIVKKNENQVELGMPGVGTYKPKGNIPTITGEDDAKSMIKRHEGLRLQPYKDTEGHMTVGYGHKIKGGEDFSKGISMEQANALFEQDYAEHKAAATKNIPGFDKMSAQQQAAMTDLTFNMGPNWIDKWPKLKEQLASGQYEAASQNLLSSKYASQVKGRSSEIAGLVAGKPGGLTGEATASPGAGFGPGGGYQLTGEEKKWFSGDPRKLAGVNPELVEGLKKVSETTGKQLPIMSGYRSTEHQAQLFAKSDRSGKMVAPPGRSMHEVGEAVDLTQGWLKKNPDVVAALKEQKLMRPMDYEDWHIQRQATLGKKAADIRAMVASAPKPGDQVEQLTKTIDQQNADNTAMNLDNQDKLISATNGAASAVASNTAAANTNLASLSMNNSVGGDKGDFAKDIDQFQGMMSIFLKNLTYGV